MTSLSGLSTDTINKIYRGNNNLAKEKLVNVSLKGKLEFVKLEYPEGMTHLNSKLPMINGSLVFPQTHSTFYQNFKGLLYLKPKKVLPIKFRDLFSGLNLKIKGKKSLLTTPSDNDCRILGSAILVTEVEYEGNVVSLIEQGSTKPYKNQSINSKDMFYLLGAARIKANPVTGMNSNKIRNILRNNINKRKIITAYLNPINGKRQIGYMVKPAVGNSWDPNWSFHFPEKAMNFRSINQMCGEFYDAMLDHLENTYVADLREAHWDIATSFFCPWGGANEILELQDHTGQKLTKSELKKILEQLGGPIEEFVNQ